MMDRKSFQWKSKVETPHFPRTTDIFCVPFACGILSKREKKTEELKEKYIRAYDTAEGRLFQLFA